MVGARCCCDVMMDGVVGGCFAKVEVIKGMMH